MLASALALGGTGALSAPAALPAAESGLCVLDPLNLICPADDAASSGTATSAPNESPTATSSPTDDAASSGAATDPTTAPTDGTATGDGAPSDGTSSGTNDGTASDGTSTGTPTGDAPDPGSTADGTDADTKAATADTPDTPDGTTDQASVEAAAKDGVEALADQLKLCLGEGKDLGSSSDVTAPNLSSHLSGSKFQITNSWYQGNVTLQRLDGTGVRAMKFTADKAVVPDFRLDVPAKADGSQGLVATSDSITMKDDVLLYATKFSGKLLGIPLTFTPECAPPGFIPLPSMTDVKIEMVANTADSLAYDNPHQEVYEH